ncbi:serine hydroxymethyltransferase [Vibrio coralliirubri]|uniref:serine hydroxymethyltransferase n=1 Tax=Vibrio coralliirubri TaxID=1516159 RepID=UPI0022834416|nr:serine hydroxymethyltransferase [Vibrio coralliirubri]MCY9861190.1 serine hydroxymethyltransferase [Vibrio coralliirubri]
MLNKSLHESDSAIFECIQHEKARQFEHIELIASENYASLAVREAQGSILTNKYAEGYPFKRYYGGCEFVDDVEVIAIERLCELFGVQFANVQPHSGSQANQAAYLALMECGDTLLGMDLSSGGHLTHGAKVSSSGKIYKSLSYGITDEGLIDYDQVEQLATEHRPKVIMAGFSAYSGIVDWSRFREIADTIGAYLVADIAHVAGLVAVGLYPTPVGHAHVITSTTHKTLGGPRGGVIMTNDEIIAKKINSAVFPALQGGPLMHVIAAKAVAFKEALSPEFALYQAQVLKNAKAMADAFIAEGVEIVGGGTHNHLMLIKTKPYMTGKDFEELLSEASITLNKNSVPNDTEKPFITSGVRIGTPAVTRRGFNESDCSALATLMAKLLKGEVSISEVKSLSIDLCTKYVI